MSNPKVQPGHIISGAVRATSESVGDKDVMVLNDTTELNYQRHIGYLDKDDPDLGPTGNNKDIGFFLHPGYMVDRSSGIGLGVSYVKIWNRRFDKLDKHQRDYKNQAITEKESYRWIECAQESKSNLSMAAPITTVGDRENDIFEGFVTVPDAKTDLLIRSCRNRSLHGSPVKLNEAISADPLKGSFLLDVKKHKTRGARLTTIKVRYTRVKIKRPKNCKNKSLPQYVWVTAR